MQLMVPLLPPRMQVSRVSHIDGLVQDCSISSALAMEILQSCTKPLICTESHIRKVLLCCGLLRLRELSWCFNASCLPVFKCYGVSLVLVHSYDFPTPRDTGFKQSIFLQGIYQVRWLISNELEQKVMVFNSHYLILTTCISYHKCIYYITTNMFQYCLTLKSMSRFPPDNATWITQV